MHVKITVVRYSFKRKSATGAPRPGGSKSQSDNGDGIWLNTGQLLGGCATEANKRNSPHIPVKVAKVKDALYNEFVHVCIYHFLLPKGTD